MKIMKTLLTILMLLIVGCAFGQADDTTKYTKYPGIYGLQYPRYWATKVLRPPSDTIYSKTGIARIGSTLYVGNGTRWTETAGGGNIVSIVNNFFDSTASEVNVFNDSTIIVCIGNGACDTISIETSITNISNVHFLTDSSVVVCDSLASCDTIVIGRQSGIFAMQNWIRRVGSENIYEFGSDDQFSPLVLGHNTYLDAGGFVARFGGSRLFNYPYEFWQRQYVQGGTGIMSFLGEGSAPTGGTLKTNTVRFGINYADDTTVVTPSYKEGVLGPYTGYFIAAN